MRFERASMAQLKEIQRLIGEGHSDRKIAKALRCRRLQIAAVRKKVLSPDYSARQRRGKTDSLLGGHLK